MGYENQEKNPIYVSKKCEEKLVDLLLIGEYGKRHHVLIKDFNTFMYNMEENIFVIIVYKLSAQKKYQSVILKTALKLTVNKAL